MSSFRPALTLVPAKYTTPDGVRLGQWVNVQRRTKEGFSSERRTRLEAINGWTWNRRDAGWEEAFTRLQQYVEAEGHARVPRSYVTPDGDKLGQWVTVMRSRKERLSPDRQRRLEALPGWVWHSRDAGWEEAFTRLQQYVETEGHARVSKSYKTRDGDFLGVWVGTQRRTKERLSSKRQRRLQALPGWVWHSRDAGWEEAFTRLQQYVETEGHARVPFGHRTADGEKLGLWVSNQRLKKGRLPPERRQRLQALKGWLWNTREAAWEDGFGQLQRYVETEGHALVPQSHLSPDGFRLGLWVSNQRARRRRLSPERRARLEALRGWVWTR